MSESWSHPPSPIPRMVSVSIAYLCQDMYPTYPGLLVWGDGEVRAVGHELRGDDGREGAAHPIADLQTVHRGDGCSHTVRLVTSFYTCTLSMLQNFVDF